jgi:hypothetical protein
MTVPSPTLDRIPITDCFTLHSKYNLQKLTIFQLLYFLNLDGGNKRGLVYFIVVINKLN